MYSAAEIKKMLGNRGQRSKLSWNQLPEQYKLMRARNAVMGKKGAKAPQSYRDKLIAEMQANPGKRALLPDKYLTPDQLKSRRTNTYLNSEVFPGAGMKGSELETQVRRGLQLQYGDQEQADARAVAQAEANRTRNQAWWNQYQQAVQNAQTSFNQYAQQQQAPQISTSAPVVSGQVASPTAPAASGVQAALGSIAAARANSDQLASAAGLASNVNIAGQRVGEQRALLDQAVQNAISQQKQTGRRKQMSAEELRSKLIDEAQRRFLEKAGILTKQQQLDQAQALAEMRDRTTRRGQDITSDTTRRGQDISSETTRRGQDLRDKPDSKKPKKLNKPTESQVKDFRDAFVGAAGYKKHNPAFGSDAAYTWLKRKKNGVPDILKQAAAEAAVDGFIHTATANALHKNLGIRVRDLGYPIGNPRKKSKKTRGGNVDNNNPR